MVDPGWEPAAGLVLLLLPSPPVPALPTWLGAVVAWMPSELPPWDCPVLLGPGRSSCGVGRGRKLPNGSTESHDLPSLQYAAPKQTPGCTLSSSHAHTRTLAHAVGSRLLGEPCNRPHI